MSLFVSFVYIAREFGLEAFVIPRKQAYIMDGVGKAHTRHGNAKAPLT